MARDRKPAEFLPIGLVLLGCHLVGPPLPASPDGDEGFVPLFNGRNLDGWVVHKGVPSAWAVEDGLLVARPGSGWVMTKATYNDFELRLEYKMPKQCASSVVFRSPIEGAPDNNGIAIKLRDDLAFADFKPTELTGAIASVGGPIRTDAAKPVGRWNEMKIVAQGSRVTVDLNGVRLQDFDLDAPAIEAEAAPDPSKGHPGHPGRLRREGSIGLWGLGDWQHGRMYFRNVKIKVLGDRAKN